MVHLYAKIENGHQRDRALYINVTYYIMYLCIPQYLVYYSLVRGVSFDLGDSLDAPKTTALHACVCYTVLLG